MKILLLTAVLILSRFSYGGVVDIEKIDLDAGLRFGPTKLICKVKVSWRETYYRPPYVRPGEESYAVMRYNEPVETVRREEEFESIEEAFSSLSNRSQIMVRRHDFQVELLETK